MSIENTRRQLGELSALSKKTDDAERRILESAEKQLAVLQEKIATLRPAALLDPDKGREYQLLVSDRHRLQVVIAQAKRNLSAE